VDDETLPEWLDSLLERYLHLQFDELPDDVILDFTPASLSALQGVVAARPPGTEDIVPAVAAYLGETLLRVGGGGWTWAEGTPVVVPDPQLDLRPVAPVALVAGGQDSISVYAAWLRERQRVEAARPGWRPAQEPTDMEAVDASAARWLAEWTVSQRAALAGRPELDFSPASLAVLEEMIRSEVSDQEALRAPEHRALFDRAAWYLGETFRRTVGARWMYVGGRPVDVTAVHLHDIGGRGTSRTPALAVLKAVDNPGYLRTYYEKFAGRPH